MSGGLYFSPKTIFISPYFRYRDLFAFLLPYFAISLLFYLPFSLLLSLFLLFLLHFPPFSLPLFIVFPLLTQADIPPKGRGFSNI